MSGVDHVSPAADLPLAREVAAASPRLAYAWFVIGILMLASLISYVDRQIVSIVVAPIKHDLKVGDAEVGLLYGIFAMFYAIAGLPIAWLADRKSRKHIIAIGIFFWSLATMVCGLSRTFTQMLFARIGVGVGEASLYPSTNSLVGDLFPRDKIPMALSVFQMASVVGSGVAFIVGGLVLNLMQNVAPPTLPLLGEMKPWQLTFLIVGAPGLVIAAITLIIREPKRRTVPGTTKTTVPASVVFDFYRRNRTTLVLHHLGFLSLSLMGFAFSFWSVSYFVRVHGMEAAKAAQFFGWIYLGAGSWGALGTAMLAGWLSRRGHKDANIVAAMVGGGITIPLIILIQLTSTPTQAFLLYIPAMFFVTSPFGLAYGSLPVIAPPQIRATVAAVFMMTVNLGMMLGPPVTGLFNERIFPSEEGVRYSLMSVATIFGVIGLTLLFFCRKHYAKSLEEADRLDIAALDVRS